MDDTEYYCEESSSYFSDKTEHDLDCAYCVIPPCPQEQGMDEATKATWLTALRSGKYEQTPGYLRTHDSCYCCIGVLHDAANGQWLEIPEGYETQDAHEGEEKLSDETLKRYGLLHDTQEALIKMNDDKGWDFSKIADWIEQNL